MPSESVVEEVPCKAIAADGWRLKTAPDEVIDAVSDRLKIVGGLLTWWLRGSGEDAQFDVGPAPAALLDALRFLVESADLALADHTDTMNKSQIQGWFLIGSCVDLLEAAARGGELMPRGCWLLQEVLDEARDHVITV